MDTKALRQAARSRRDALGAAERQAKSEAIWPRLAALPAFQAASQVLFYISFGSEVDTTLMRQRTRQLGKGVCAPRCYPPDKRLIFFDVADESRLEPGPYGILQPPEDSDNISDFENPSLVVVPGLAFDAQGSRLGYGAGYYDRFLAGEGRGLPSVGLAFECQMTETLEPGPRDVAVRYVLTESRALKIR